MIKTKAQLNVTKERVKGLNEELAVIREKYIGFERQMYEDPILDDIKDLEREIIEYRKLTNFNIEEAIDDILIEPTLIENINELIAKIRIASGLSQKDLADKVGWDQPNISRYESEYYNSHTLKGIIELTSALGVWIHVTPSLTEIPKVKNRYFSYEDDTKFLPKIEISHRGFEEALDESEMSRGLFDIGSASLTWTVNSESEKGKLLEVYATDSSGSNKLREREPVPCGVRIFEDEYN